MFFRLLHIFRSFSPREHYAFFVAAFFFALSGIFLLANLYLHSTIRVAVPGGTYREGIVGQPVYLNPVISGTSDTDRDLIRLIFSSVTDVAEKIEPSKDGKVWSVRILEGAKWHDGEPLTSDDVIFTIQSILDPEAHSPLADTFHDVVVTRVSERELTLALPTPYAFFRDNLKNLYLVPKHIFEAVPVPNWRLSSYNLEPVGSGPYVFVSSLLERSGFISQMTLKRNEAYIKDHPLIETMIASFFKGEDEMIDAFNTAQIDGFILGNPAHASEVRRGHQLLHLPTSLTYAVFLNQSAHTALKDSNVRLALSYAADRAGLVESALGGNGVPVYGPLGRLLPPSTSTPALASSSADTANQILDRGGWQVGEDGLRHKGNLALTFHIVVPDYASLVDTAHFLEQAWGKIGAKLEVQVLPASEVNRNLIRSRNYEMMLFGNTLWSPDLFSFWHSSERFYPGLNLALYDNKAADRLMESVRKNFDEVSRNKDLVSLDSLIAQELPAIFLFSPDYAYVAVTNFGGIGEGLLTTASDRFIGVEKWHVRSALNLK